MSLIDVTSEDDCLIDSPLRDDTTPQFSGSFDEHGKLEGDETRGKGRYNLRKSLTWDSAFFSSAAFLEPEECTNTLESSENGEIHTLPGIQEDVDNYSDSSTMLDGEASTLRNSFVKKELETKDPKNVSSSKKLEFTNHDKVKQKAARKKANLAVTVPVKTMKQVPARPQTSQASKGTTVLKTPRRPASSTGATKIAAEGKSRVGRSQVSTFLKSPTNLNQSMSVASSYGEWSSDTSLSQSTSNKRSSIVRAGLGSGSHKVTVRNSDPEQVLDANTGSEVTGSLDESAGVHSASIKPSGLRPPSPKLGYSNGARLPGHTRTRSMDSYPSMSLIVPQIGPKSNTPSAYSNKIPTRTTTTTKERLPGHTRTRSMDSYPIMPKIGLRSNSPSAYSNKIPARTTTTKERLPGHTRTRSMDSYPIMPKIGPRSNSPSAYSNMIPARTTTTKGSYSKAQGIGSAKKITRLDVPKLVVQLGGKGAQIKDTKIVPLGVNSES
ncbi:Breast cancer type 1 susceptibility protein [Gossypium arboreum]|uniref:Breast cancer type 1 susceptibility protein n=1 Tax=Gossypium arboreum TaxID=29729 RepID=A0A0B0NIU4_GOSAR|nr:Breast cancer type 1 susceptibility protein [Gossypium arboreum]